MPDGISEEITSILYSGQLAYGKHGREFEKTLSQFFENDKVVTISTYNQALLIALSILDLQPGDEILASPVSCLASNQPFAVKGLKINWVDVNPESGTLCTDSLKSKISPKTKAIFNNLFCGYAGDLDEVYKIGKEFGIPVVDDCIEAFGTEYKGKKTGNAGADISVFSFQTVRLPNTVDGGALTFKSMDLFEKAKLIRDYGIERSNFRLPNSEINPNCDINLEGYGGTMSEINSFIGLKQMPEIPHLLERQRINAKKWDQLLRERKDLKLLKIHEDVQPNYWVYGLLADKKAEFLEEMKDMGFYATGVHINNNIYSVFGNSEKLPGVEEFMKKYAAIPCGWWLEK